MKKIKTITLLLLISIILLSIGSIFSFSLLNRSSNGLIHSVDFRISYGESAYSVGKRLADNNYIRSELYFKVLSKTHKNNQIKKGLYTLQKGDSTKDIFNKFLNGKEKMVKITIPEGLTLSKVALIFEKSGLCSKRDFLNEAEVYNFPGTIVNQYDSVEGFLYPDTYILPAETDAHFIIKSMIGEFEKTLKKAIPELDNLASYDVYKKIILASIVQREYKVDKEAPIIASVFSNRLEKPMPLQSCATVEYIITELLGKPHPKRLFYIDLEIDSPYNSYLYRGLPPTPICSPGVVALKAAFNPAKSDYLYFVVKDAATGAHSFSNSLESHNAKKSDYINLYFN